MKNNDCSEIKEMLAGYIDDELTDEERRIVEEHIDICAECASELKEMKNIREVIRNMNTPRLPDAFWQGYWDRLYNRLERHIAWIFISIGSILLLAFATYQLAQNFFVDSQISIILRIGVGAVALGAIILLVSLLRETIFASRHERYKEVKR